MKLQRSSPVRDPARVAAVLATGLLDTPAEERFDRLVRLTAAALRAPIAGVTLLDGGREFVKSAFGLPDSLVLRREIPVERSLGKHVVRTGRPIVIGRGHGSVGIRAPAALRTLGGGAYAGVPVRSPAGHVVGVLFVADRRTRPWEDAEISLLRQAAAAVDAEIERTSAPPAGLGGGEDRRHAETARAILERLPVGFGALRGERFTFVNEAFAQLCGTTRDELLRLESILDSVHSGDRDAAARRLRRQAAGGVRGGSARLRLCSRRGTPVDVDLYTSSGALDGTPVAFVVAVDATDHVRAEAVLHEETEHVRLLGRIAEDVNAASTFEAAAQACLDRVCALTGWPVGHLYVRDEAGGWTPSGVWHLADPRRFRAFRRITDATRLAPGEGIPSRVADERRPLWLTDVAVEPGFVRGRRCNAEVRTALLAPVRVGGEVVAVLEFFSDEVLEPEPRRLEVVEHVGVQLGHALERMRERQALEHSEQRFSGIVSLATDAVVSVDASQRIVLFNRAAEEIFGYSAGEAVGQPMEALIPEESRARHDQLFRSFTESREVARRMGSRGAIRGRRKDGSTFRAEASISRLELDGDSIFTAVLRDVTEQVQMEEALRESELHFRSIFDNTYQFMGLLTPDGILLEANRRALEFAGVERGDVIGRPYWETPWWSGSPESGRALHDAVRRAAGGEFVQYEVDWTAPDGTVAAVDFSLHPVRDDSGAVTLLIPEGRDITRRKEAERALMVSEERLRLAARATQEVVWEWDMATSRVLWGPNAAHALRYGADEIVPSIEWWYQRIHPDEREQIIGGLHETVNGTAETWSAEYRFQRGDGSWATVLDRGVVVRTERGAPVRAVGSMLDVTERRRAEDVQKFLARASALLDTSLDYGVTLPALARLVVPTLADYCLIDVAADGVLRRVAAAHAVPAREALLGQGEARPLGTDRGDPVARAMRKKQAVVIPSRSPHGLRAVRPNGDRDPSLADLAPRSTIVVPLVSHDEPLGVLTLASTDPARTYGPMDLFVAEDLARRIMLSIENARLFEQAQRAIRAREQVLGVVTHDLRNPLGIIAMSMEMIRASTSERRASHVQWLDIIARAVDDMGRMIEDLLDLSSIDSGGFSLAPADQRADAFVGEACDLLQPLAKQKSLTLSCEVSGEVSNVWIDGRQVLRVLSNLIGNAIKFTPEGGAISLRVERVGDDACFSVRDTGSGIAPEHLPHVFDRYWQAGRGDRRGAGLGLAIARGIVEGHGGRIWVESEPGTGTTFFFTLPLHQRPPSEAEGGAP